MKMIRLLAAFVPFLLFSAAHAETVITSRSGAWSAFEGASDDGHRVCGVVTSGRHMEIGLKHFEGTDALTVHITKRGWTIPLGMPIGMILRFSGETPWVIRGRGHRNLIEFSLRGEAVGVFIREFRSSSRGFIRFVDGNEGDWAINLTGSLAATNAMAECMGRISERGRGTSQPYGQERAPRSQPPSPSGPPEDRRGPAPVEPGQRV